MSSSELGRALGQDPHPAERVLALVDGQHVGDRRPADAVEAVAARDQVALERVLLALVRELDLRRLRVHRHVGDLEVQRQPGLQPRADQVLDDLLLAVDRDRAAAGQVAQRDPVALAAEPQLDAVVHQPLARASARRARPRPSGPSSPARARRRARAAARTRGRAPRGSPTRCPRSSSSRPSISPAGPPPTIATWVRMDGSIPDTVRYPYQRLSCEHTPRSRPSPMPSPI